MATTKYYLSGTSKVRNMMSAIADALVTTGKWQKVVDNTPTTGTAPATTQFLILSPVQTYQFRTVNGATVDNGAGTSPRYSLAMATGAERIYYKFTPLYNASNLQMGASIQMCNQMNAGGTDYYGTTAQIETNGGIYDYKYADNTASSSATWGITNTYYHKVACTKMLVSPTNTNYLNHDLVFPYTTFVDPESDVRFWITAGTDDSPTLANSKDKEDWAIITVQGLTGTKNTIMTTMIGTCKSAQVWHNNWGVVRAFIRTFSNSLQTWTGQNFAGVTSLAAFSSFATSGFQDPSILLNGYNYRFMDISLLTGAQTNGRLASRTKYDGVFSTYSSTQDGLSGAFLGGGSNQNCAFNALGAYSNIVDSDEPYKTGKIFADIFSDAYIYSLVGAIAYYSVGATSSSNASSNSSYPHWHDKTYFILPESTVYIGNNVAGNIIQNTVNAGDFVTYNGRKYVFVKYSGASTYAASTYYNYAWYIDFGAV